MMGFTKKGVFFHIGLVKIGEQNFSHHYGHAKWILGAVKPLIDISKGNRELEKLQSDESKISFNAKFADREEFFFEIFPKEKDENIRKLYIDGIEGRCLIIVDEDNEWQRKKKGMSKKKLARKWKMISNGQRSGYLTVVP